MSKFAVFAPNVKHGGGYILLLQYIKTCGNDYDFYLNESLKKELGVDGHKYYYSGLIGRLKAEYELAKSSYDLVISFNNIPPLLYSNGTVDVFFQNVNILKSSSFYDIKNFLNKVLIISLKRNVRKFYVQTETTRLLLNKALNDSNIVVAPYYSIECEVLPSTRSQNDRPHKKEIKFCYPAAFHPHKNHKNLVLAFSKLIKDNQNLSLILTITDNDYRSLTNEVFDNIKAVGQLDYEGSIKLMSKSDCLIFPSFNESYGLPLVEASMMGVDIIATEADYIWEVSSPKETFDPNNVSSIVRAVQRYIGNTSVKKQPMSPDSFRALVEMD